MTEEDNQACRRCTYAFWPEERKLPYGCACTNKELIDMIQKRDESLSRPKIGAIVAIEHCRDNKWKYHNNGSRT